VARPTDQRAKRKYVRVKPRPPHMWQPGQCGNPGGRPTRNIRELATRSKEYTDAVYSQFEDMLADPTTKPETRLAICRELLDRAYGRPTQGVSLFGSDEEPAVKIMGELKLNAEQMRQFVEKGRELDESV